LGLRQQDLGGALRGVSRVLSSIACLWVMCDPRDIRTYFYLKAPFTGLPTLYFYDNYPGGVGFSEKVYRLHDVIWSECKKLIESCSCQDGCPSCVGPMKEIGAHGKTDGLKLLDWMTFGKQ